MKIETGVDEMTDNQTGDLRAHNIAIVEKHLAAINAWDFDTMENELFHKDIRYELPCVPAPFPKLTEGIDSVLAFTREVPAFAIEENLHDIRVDTLGSDPNELVAEYRSDMKLASGRPYRNVYLVRISIKDGKIIRFCEFFDTGTMIEAMGGSFDIPEMAVDAG
jgi:ketosteroid isomerase-like protein